MYEVCKVELWQFNSLPANEKSALKESAVERYCQNLKPKLVAKREAFESEQRNIQAEHDYQQAHLPKCPTFGSTNVHKIGGVE
jgi:hypothetical protein